MMSDGDIKHIESKMDQGENVDHCDVRDLVGEVRTFRAMLEGERARSRFLKDENEAVYELAQYRADLLDKTEAERESLRKRVEALEAAILEYARAGDVVTDTPEARQRFAEAHAALQRLIAFRPRVRARSEVGR